MNREKNTEKKNISLRLQEKRRRLARLLGITSYEAAQENETQSFSLSYFVMLMRRND
jgi:hypothetical protein